MMYESLVFKIQDVSCSSERFLEFCLREILQAFIPRAARFIDYSVGRTIICINFEY